MGLLTGKWLSALAAALIALSAAAAVRIALSEGLGSGNAEISVSPVDPLSAEDHLERARAAEGKTDVASALAHYRAAVARKPQLVDRKSPEFLGPAFERKLKDWVAELKRGKIEAGPAALPDASYLFRRMYGGCG